ncbi:Uncharacterized protein C458.02c [Serendipita indica DSM 11827]|uniref:Related to BFR1-Nuclear segregation protein n=1 Tax=Serendipita indica (strain DSM 11827) TaxID=1109443 RepID=G4TUB5_SERID|nr:Uncharacterized protein C458.02c [Serendipita indica DSM 11827]CCA74908.1 related to BFR1-Nuclear segregation protein [Serendipita indica DSM 11827]
MPPKGKQAANGKTDANKPAKSTTSAAASASAAGSSKPAATTATTVTKPDTTAYHAEQDALKKEIDETQAKLNAVKEKINLAKGGGANERRDALRAELDAIRGQQGSNKASRQKLKEQIDTLQTNVQNKVKALQAARGKSPYKTIDDVNAQITKLDNLVNSGTMKIVDERKTLQEISSLKRLRKTIESFQSEQDDIEKDRAQIDALRKQYDDPESKALSEKYDQIKAELDEIKKESDTAYQGRTKLFDERTELQTKLDELWKKKKESAAAHKEAGDAYWKKVNEDRARRAERAMAEKKAAEEAKRRQIAEEMLEQAKEPAFAADIQDCQTLIDYFSRLGGLGSAGAQEEATSTKATSSSAPQLELRKVENTMEGYTALKKKGEEENNYFVAKKTKKGPAPKAYGSAAPAPPQQTSTSNPAEAQLNIGFGTLSGLMALSIPPPTNMSEIPRVIDDLKTKKAWYQANQAKATKDNIAKAEAQIEKLNKAAAAAAASQQQEEAPATEEASAPVEATA